MQDVMHMDSGHITIIKEAQFEEAQFEEENQNPQGINKEVLLQGLLIMLKNKIREDFANFTDLSYMQTPIEEEIIRNSHDVDTDALDIEMIQKAYEDLQECSITMSQKYSHLSQ